MDDDFSTQALITPASSMKIFSEQLKRLLSASEKMAEVCDFRRLNDEDNQQIRRAMARAQYLMRQMEQEDSPLNGIQWNPARALPSPGAPLVLRLADNSTMEGVRPRHVQSYQSGDLGYRDLDNQPVSDVVAWRYQ